MRTYNNIKDFIGRNRNIINIFLVYFFLTFTIGFLDFDRRVESFEASVNILKQLARGEAEVGPSYARRILIPFTVYLFHKISHLSLNEI